MLEQLEPTTIAILLAIALLFIIAYKVLQIVIHVFMITVFSAGFYTAVTYFIESISFELNQMLFFALVGGGVYLGIKLLKTSYSITSKIISVPKKIIGSIF